MEKLNHRIYLDYAATTPLHPEVFKAMKPYYFEKFANPSSLHTAGLEARDAIEKARKKISDALGATPDEIVFTSGGSESDNMAIKGVAYAMANKGNHIITTKIEHHAVLEPMIFLQKQGYNVTFLPVDNYGVVDPDDVKKAITDRTVLVSIMHGNNEIGTIEPMAEISKICREQDVYLHTDAVQSFGAVNTDVNKLGVDLLSLSAHKFYGPKGTGVLYIRKGTRIEPLIHGGAQEMGKRASTQNVPGIVGMACAAELAIKEMKERVGHSRRLRDRLMKSILTSVDDVILNGHPEKRLPNNCHFTVKYIEGEALLLRLDQAGIEVATGSACSSGSLEPSHVLTAIGITIEDARGSIRITVGRLTTEEDIDYVCEIFPQVVKQLRAISPIAKNK